MQNDSTQHQELISQLMRDFIKEKRSDRFWRNVRFFIVLLIFIAVLALVLVPESPGSLSEGEGDGYVSLVRLQGMIAPGENFSAETVIPLLVNAFKDKNAAGVIIDINSGGGTPVQASIIHDAIIRLKTQYHKKVIVVGEDMLASGAYFVAVAADKIYVNPNTITGSIGVIMKGFGFPELIKKVGIERRVYTSGVNKDRLDPFLPQTPEDVAKINQVIGEVHTNFDDMVLSGRKGKLKGDPNHLFTGDFWSGTGALQLGLVDGLGNLDDVMHSEFKVQRYKDYSESEPFLQMLANQAGTELNLILNETETKLLEKFN